MIDFLKKTARAAFSTIRPSLLPGIIVFFSLVSASFAQDSPTLTVSRPGTHLYAGHKESSHIITKLDAQETLIPLATIVGSAESWHFVKTQKGISGWVKSTDVREADKTETASAEGIADPAELSSPEMREQPSTAPFQNAVTVPVEVTGSMVVVPVLINRSLKTFMVMDRGTGYSRVSPRIAKRLGLRTVSRISVTTGNATISIPLTRLGSLKLGDTEVHGLMATVQSVSDDPRIEGLLGRNFLSRFHTSIDPRRQLLSIAPR